MGLISRSTDNEEVFLRHGIGSDFDPMRLTAPSIVALAMDLQDVQLSQRRSAAVGSGSRRVNETAR